MMNYDRQSRLWRVRETKYCLFHLEPPLHEDEDLAATIAGADARYLRVREVLGKGPVSVQEREGLLKLNYWLYGESAIADADMPPGTQRFSTGAGSPAGIVFAVRGLRWSECVGALTHETIHVLWGVEAGEAPSLLNEGVAVYFETLLSDQPGESLQSLARSWEHLIDSGAVSLRSLCRNDGFWKDYRQDQGLPPGGNYQIGGALVAYLVDVHGLLLLKEIFLASHYRDEHLASTLERLVGLSVEELSARVSAWWPHRAGLTNRVPLAEKAQGITAL